MEIFLNPNLASSRGYNGGKKMDEFTKEAMKMMAFPIVIGLGILGFVVWVIIKLMQHFGVV